jgi:spermidine synthase
LVGSAAGAALYQRWLAARKQEKLADHLLLGLALACLAGTSSLWAGERVRNSLQAALGDGFAAALGAEALLALFAFGPATVLMGALFSQLSRSANAAGVSFGRALGVNTLAAALAPAICGVLAIPALGAKVALLLIAIGYCSSATRTEWLSKWGVALAGLVLLVALLAPPLRFIELTEGAELISYEEGVMAAVSVVQDAGGVARLRINNRQQEGSSATRRVDARQAWLPLLLHPGPQKALFLGLGTGVTASSAAEDPSLRVDAVELLPEVIRASRQFSDDSTLERLHVFNADARRYVRTATQSYDVIVSDNFHPARRRAAVRARSTRSSTSWQCARASAQPACSASGCRSISSTWIRCAASCVRS